MLRSSSALALVLAGLTACGSSPSRGTPDGGDPPVDAANPGDAPIAIDGGGGTTDGGETPDGGGTSAIAACGELEYTSAMRLATSNATLDRYLRCASMGPERGARAAVSADGARVAVITSSGTVRLFATAPWSELVQLAAPRGRVDALAFSPDGARLATLSVETGDVTLWAAADGALVRDLGGADGSVIESWRAALAWSADGTRLATSLGNLFDVATGATVATFGARAARRLAFLPGGAGQLFVDAEVRIGNSPLTRRVSVVDLSTGAQTDLFDMYDRALTGAAISADGGVVALSKTAEAEVNDFAPGLTIYRTATGAEMAADPAFPGRVLALSRDGTRVFTVLDDTVTVLDTTDLGVVAQFAWPSDAELVDVAPSGELVARLGGTTTWRDPMTGAIRQMLPYALADVAWTADGAHGVGAAPDTMFALWREAGAASLCTPPAIATAAPALASLGNVADADGDATSSDGSTSLSSRFVRHTHAVDYYSAQIEDTAGGSVVRTFGAQVGRQPAAISNPSGDKVFTIEGDAVATWCR